MRSISEVCQQLNISVDRGLSPSVVAESRQRFGANTLTPLPRTPLWKKFVAKFDEPIIKILLAAALLSMFVDLFQSGIELWIPGVALLLIACPALGLMLAGRGDWVPALSCVATLLLFVVGVKAGHPSIEGLAVMLAVILATGVSFLSEYKSDREFEVLNARKETIHVKVLRDGTIHQLSLEEVVVGDVVAIETGDEVPADGRILHAVDLSVDQSLMTGESEPAAKGSDDDELYRGTQVVDGAGRMLVTEVGDATSLGQIALRLAVADDEETSRVQRKLSISKTATPLQIKLENLAGLISRVGYIAAGAIFVALVVRGLWLGEVRVVPQSGEAMSQALLASGRALLNYFVYMVIIVVVAVPEGLPMSVTVSLALAMRKMTRANCLVRQLVACETIGSATVICTDKTGTLTQNRMRVAYFFCDGSVIHEPAADWLALNAALNSTANLDANHATIGNSTEGALLLWLRGAGVDYRALREKHPPLMQIHFSSERKRMTTVVAHDDRPASLVKGAPEWVLQHSTHYRAADGSARPWTPDTSRGVEEALREAARQAMRTLAFAHAELPSTLPADRDLLDEALVFDGLVAIRDPLRPDVVDAVAQCRSAGIEVKMITGDNVETARAIACDAGLLDRRDEAIDTEDSVVLTSPVFNARYAELMALRAHGDESAVAAARRRLTRFRVLARARPLDKYKMVELLQEEQQVVAVTGDGTNDAPALKKADVGLAMGIAGTEVAKEASKIVLLDDAFSTIVRAVHWGRSLYENIQRFVQFQLTINASALALAFLGPFVGVRPPFTVLQLLWINVIMDTFASIALCSEPPRAGVMRMPPKKRDENLLTPAMKRTIFLTAGFFVVVMMTILIGMKYGRWFASGGGPDPEGWDLAPLNRRQVTIFFTAYVFFQVWNQINCRALTPDTSGLTNLFGNPTFLAIAATIGMMQFLIVSVPWLGTVFKTEPLGVVDWATILVGTASVLLFAEATRRMRRI